MNVSDISSKRVTSVYLLPDGSYLSVRMSISLAARTDASSTYLACKAH